MNNNEFRFENIFRESCSSNMLELSDGRLRTEDGQAFDIHRVILARSSKYFYVLFCGTGEERNEIIIPGIRGDILSNILYYIYTRNICVTKENIRDVFVAADYLLLDELIMDIRRELSCYTSVSNCLSLYVTIMHMNYSDILQKTFRFIQMHFEAIMQDNDSEFSALPLEALKNVLRDKNLRLRDENTVWLAIVKWVQADISNRQCQVPDLLIYLTIRDVDEEFAARILEHSIVADNPFCNEMHQMKMSNSFTTNFRVLFDYFSNHLQPTLPLDRLRQPTNLNFIVENCFQNGHSVYQLYVTYDENIDLWRKIIDLRHDFPVPMRPKFIVSLGFNIYVFRTNGNLCYNLADKMWVEMTNGQIRGTYGVVKLEGLIYVLGYKYSENLGIKEAVEIYDPDRNEWREVARMNKLTSFSAVTLRKYIYVIGSASGSKSLDMMVQVYDPKADTWMLLSSPLISRYSFTVVVHRERIFVLGGRSQDEDIMKDVEVFDPVKDEWTTKKELPYSYDVPKAIVLNDNLIVYENCYEENRTDLDINSPVQWDEEQECWISVGPSSPLNDLNRYEFFTVDNTECIGRISRENRDPETTFVKSPFN